MTLDNCREEREIEMQMQLERDMQLERARLLRERRERIIREWVGHSDED